MPKTYRTQLFVSYSRKDQEWLDRIRDVFAAHARNLRVEYWDDREIVPGDRWFEELTKAIDHAKVALLLVSPNFLESKFIMNEELPRILKAQEDGLTVFWVPLFGKFSGADAHPAVGPLAELQTATRSMKPLAEFASEAVHSALIKLQQEVHRQFVPRTPQNLPFPSIGSLFKGREEFLAQLHATLSAEHFGHKKAAAITPATTATVYGLGGIGKTRTALEYAHRYADQYTALLFVQADSPASLQANLAALCGPLVLDLAEHTARETEVQVAAVLQWLQQNPGWFLILDNVDTEEAAKEVQTLLARLAGAGKVVITSRLSAWGGGVEPLELGVLAVEDAIEFLLERTEKGRRKQADDPAQARVLAEELGQLALALEQAGAYIVDDRATFAGYLEAWRKNHDKVIEWFDERIMQYPRSVAVTWQTSFDRLSDPARHLLRLLSWLAPDPIPESLLAAGGGPSIAGDDSSAEPPEARRALAELARYSLVKRSDEPPAFSVHRLVQDVTRRTLPEDERLPSLKNALRWVDAAFVGNPQDSRSWEVQEPLLPHAQVVAVSADQRGLCDPTSRLMNHAAQLLHEKAQYPAAEPLYRRSLALTEKAYGPENTETASCLDNLATFLGDTNQQAEVEALTRRALAIDERAYGPNHPKVSVRLSNLACWLCKASRLAEAEPLMRRSLAIDEASYGSDHPEVTQCLNNLAQLLQVTNRIAEAEPLMRRVLAIDEASCGPDHPYVARDLFNLAFLLHATNRLAEAEPLMRRALAVDEAAYGADHPKVASDLCSLADLLRDTNRLTEAEPLVRRALAINEASYGSDHPEVSKSLNILVLVLQATNRLDEAEPLVRRALAIDEASHGSDHPNVAISLNILVLVLQATNRLDEAESLIRRAIIILLQFARETGHLHMHWQAAVNNYGGLLAKMGYSQGQILATLREIAPEFFSE